MIDTKNISIKIYDAMFPGRKIVEGRTVLSAQVSCAAETIGGKAYDVAVLEMATKEVQRRIWDLVYGSLFEDVRKLEYQLSLLNLDIPVHVANSHRWFLIQSILIDLARKLSNRNAVPNDLQICPSKTQLEILATSLATHTELAKATNLGPQTAPATEPTTTK